jgi:hypothetical protein
MTIALLRVMKPRGKAKENEMTVEKYTKIIEDGVEVEITKNPHGFFCDSWNGIPWPYSWSAQCAAPTEQAAIDSCLEAINEANPDE